MTIRRVSLMLWWFADSGGMEQHVVNLARALVERGVEVTVFSQMPLPRKSVYAGRLEKAGVRIFAPPPWTRILVRLKPYRKPIRGALFTLFLPLILVERAWWKLRGYPGPHRDMWDRAHEIADEITYVNHMRAHARRTVDREQDRRPADLVHVHGFRIDHVWAVAWARSRGIPVVYTEHGTATDWEGLYEQDAPENLLRADVIASISERSREALYAYIPRETTVEIAPHVLDLPRQWTGEGEASPSKDSPLRVTCVARLQKEKGVDRLLLAVKEMHDEGLRVRLLLAGDGPDRRRLGEMVSRLGLEGTVAFRGRFRPDDLGSLMAETDVVALPSLTEGMPLALFEAMAYGKAIVATRVGGVPELIRHEETGLLVEPDDPGAIAGALARLHRERELRTALGVAARAEYDRREFGGLAPLEATWKMYETAVARRRGR